MSEYLKKMYKLCILSFFLSHLILTNSFAQLQWECSNARVRDTSTNKYVFSYNLATINNIKDTLVAIGLGGATFISTDDGKTWKKQHVGFAELFFSTASDGKSLVAPGASGVIALTNDLKHWEKINLNTCILKSVVFGGNQFIVVGDLGTIITSNDSKNWTFQKQDITTNFFHSIAYDGAGYLIVGNRGVIIRSKKQGIWEKCSSGTNYDLHSVIYTDSQYIACGDAGTILVSSDGVVWKKVVSNVKYPLNSVAFNGNQIVVIGRDGIISSTDGLKWTINSVCTDVSLNCVISYKKRFIAVGESETIVISKTP